MKANYFNISAVILELRMLFFFDVKKLWSRKMSFDYRVRDGVISNKHMLACTILRVVRVGCRVSTLKFWWSEKNGIITNISRKYMST